MSPSSSQADRYGLVGHPVAHSRSPMIHELFARQTGEKLTYELIDAAPEQFETAVRGFQAAGGKGLNVTVPHKERAFALAAEHGPEAQAAHAVNTLSFRDELVRGDNTDGIGFIRDLTINHDEDIAHRRVLILGAGGAARGIIRPLLAAGPESLLIANRTLERAEKLVAELDSATLTQVCRFEDLARQRPFDLVINATSAGLKGEQPPFPASLVGRNSFCYDLAYSLRTTPFLAWARENGARAAVQGWGMLIEQAAESFAIWRGKRPDTAPILKQLAAAIGA